jgi:peptidoglycan/LPS O-acetylase OafA/YrhL
MQRQPASHERFVTLDLLRGLAALAILTRHLSWSDLPSRLTRDYLAVDLFFVLSGFVIAHAYERRFAAGLGSRRFAIARLIRLYPLYACGTLLAAIEYLASGSAHRGVRFALDFATGMLFLPSPGGGRNLHRELFALNGPAWSLFFELVVNMGYALVFRWLDARRLGAIVAGCAVLLAALIAFEGNADFGLGWNSVPGGFLRACFGFSAGVAIYRVRLRHPAPRVPGVPLAAVACAVMLAGDFVRTAAFDVGFILVGAPLLVWLGASATIGAIPGRIALALGFLSYPVYVMQSSLITLFWNNQGLLPGGAPPNDTPWLFALRFAVVVVPSAALGVWFDRPVRAWLVARFVPERPAAAAQTAP